jgi:hypothetical protein
MKKIRFLSVSLFVVICGGSFIPMVQAAPSIARDWDEQILAAIRQDTPHPPVHARNLFTLSACMYDAWAAYDTNAVGFLYHGKHTADDLAAARREAISYAAWRILKERFVYSKTRSNTLAALDLHMLALGYPTNNFSLDLSTPAGVGNTVYLAVSNYFILDGARQLQAYADLSPAQGGYQSYNPPLVTGLPGTFVYDVNRWQPLAITNALDQNGFPAGPIQVFVGAQWLGVRPFALQRESATLPWIDPGPQPQLGGVQDQFFKTEVVDVIRKSGEMTPDDGAVLDISPGAFGNNSLGLNDGSGRPLNPFTGQPYAPNLVKRGDFARVLAEFWADGPTSETPPGHWNVLANQVADHPQTVKQIGGTGPVVDDLEWDVKVYFVLNAALHDAACAAWSLKRYYDGGRPIESIRYMGGLGQSSNPALPSYHPQGLPLVTNLIELVTSATAAVGERHAGFPTNSIAILTWPGQPANPTNQYSGTRWIQATTWMPYQRANFVTPAFPGYISGHSTFSRAGAEVLAAVTGSSFFPGGLGHFVAPSNTFLAFERGPTAAIDLQWATYFDGADQAGLSRLWGGIHVSIDDLTGRRVGSQVGQSAWTLGRKYFDGSITNNPIYLTLNPLTSTTCLLRFNTTRGMRYQLQSTPSLDQSFINESPAPVLATDTQLTRTNFFTAGARIFRVIGAVNP